MRFIIDVFDFILTIILCIIAVITLPLWVIPYMVYTNITKKGGE